MDDVLKGMTTWCKVIEFLTSLQELVEMDSVGRETVSLKPLIVKAAYIAVKEISILWPAGLESVADWPYGSNSI